MHHLLEFADELVQFQAAVFLQLLEPGDNLFLGGKHFRPLVRSEGTLFGPKHFLQRFFKGLSRGLNLEQVARRLQVSFSKSALLPAKFRQEVQAPT